MKMHLPCFILQVWCVCTAILNMNKEVYKHNILFFMISATRVKLAVMKYKITNFPWKLLWWIPPTHNHFHTLVYLVQPKGHLFNKYHSYTPIHYARAAANLNSGYAKVARVHYFCTIALHTSRSVLTRAWASRRAYLRERRVDLFS